jgi:hypothetical protein
MDTTTNNTSRVWIALTVFVILVAGIYFFFFRSAPQSGDTANTPGNTVVCTMDARQCPDGTYVGRTGPNCEFICPSGPTTTPGNPSTGTTYPADMYK